jgi:hypothetical protein
VDDDDGRDAEGGAAPAVPVSSRHRPGTVPVM